MTYLYCTCQIAYCSLTDALSRDSADKIRLAMESQLPAKMRLRWSYFLQYKSSPKYINKMSIYSTQKIHVWWCILLISLTAYVSPRSEKHGGRVSAALPWFVAEKIKSILPLPSIEAMLAEKALPDNQLASNDVTSESSFDVSVIRTLARCLWSRRIGVISRQTTADNTWKLIVPFFCFVFRYINNQNCYEIIILYFFLFVNTIKLLERCAWVDSHLRETYMTNQTQCTPAGLGMIISHYATIIHSCTITMRWYVSKSK